MAWLVETGGGIAGEATPELVRSWEERGARNWVVGKKVEPGLWTDASGPKGARTEFVRLVRK